MNTVIATLVTSARGAVPRTTEPFVMDVRTVTNDINEMEKELDIREARRALAEPGASVPLDDVLARYAAELADIRPDDW
ncbi:hypothetical protein [Micromonospora sp. NPDC004551]|uniref:hypothetical protein n=1 Tax=Micromonospora sp. NPDC004551 TaxID=3154284 RepID=UPI00339EB852